MPVYAGDTAIAGVPGTAAPIRLDFADIAGGSCGALLPTGHAVDTIAGTEVTLIDNGMPVVVLRAADLDVTGYEEPAELEANERLRSRLEDIRLQAGKLMNLGDVTSTTVPKLTLVAPPRDGGSISTRTFIPHRVHDAIGVLGAVSVATAALLPDSPAHGVLEGGRDGLVVVEHPTGTFDASIDVTFAADGTPEVGRAGIIRTARKLMDGVGLRARVLMERDDPARRIRTRTPRHRFTPPPGACDAHCHIFGPGDKFPYAADRAYTPPDSGIDDFERLQQRLGLSRAVFVQASCHGTDNTAMVDALRRGQGRYAGVAMIDESFSDADIAELHAAGVRGTRFNFVAHLGGAPELDEFWRIVHRVVPLGWHIVLHFDAKDLTHYASLLDDMPCAYVIDHMARVDASAGVEQAPFLQLLELMADERCWVKISGAERLTAGGTPPYDDVVPYARALIAAAPDRVLWGTDWPHPNVRHMADDGDLVDVARRLRARRDHPQPHPRRQPDRAVRLQLSSRNASPSASTRRTSYGPRIE